MRSLLFVLAALPALHATAEAGTLLHIVFDQKAAQCKHTTQSILLDKWIVMIEVASADKPALAEKALSVSLRDADKGTELAKATLAAAQPAALTWLPASSKLTVQLSGGSAPCTFLAVASLVVPQVTTDEEKRKKEEEAKKEKAAAEQKAKTAAALVTAARQFLSAQHITDHAKVGGWRGKTYRLYHLPDGSPAFPLPNTIAEEDRIELWIAAEAGAVPTAEITACKETPIARISGTRPGAAKEAVNTPETGETPPQQPPPEIQLIRAAPSVKCSDQLAYKINGGAGEREVTLKIAPVYLFAWGLAYGFDFGRPTRLKVVDVPVDGGTERSIVKESDRTGLRPMITLTLNACRANLADWDLCDAIGLTAMADLGRLTEGGGLGVKLQPYPGLGILVGVTLYQVDTLEVGRERDVENLAIDKEFRWQSFGLFLGVGGDTETVKALF